MISVMDGRRRAARAVTARRGELGMTQGELAAAAGVDIKTIGSLERRGRWPIARTRALIEKGLGWPVGELERIAAEEEPEQPDPVTERIRAAFINAGYPPERADYLTSVVRGVANGTLTVTRRDAEPGEDQGQAAG